MPGRRKRRTTTRRRRRKGLGEKARFIQG